MKCSSDPRSALLLALAVLLALLGAVRAEAGVPLDLYRSFAGQVAARVGNSRTSVTTC